jgi:hypothetical protein
MGTFHVHVAVALVAVALVPVAAKWRIPRAESAGNAGHYHQLMMMNFWLILDELMNRELPNSTRSRNLCFSNRKRCYKHSSPFHNLFNLPHLSMPTIGRKSYSHIFLTTPLSILPQLQPRLLWVAQYFHSQHPRQILKQALNSSRHQMSTNHKVLYKMPCAR